MKDDDGRTKPGDGPGFDSAIYSGYRFPHYYDNLAGKLISRWGLERVATVGMLVQAATPASGP